MSTYIFQIIYRIIGLIAISFNSSCFMNKFLIFQILAGQKVYLTMKYDGYIYLKK